MVTPSRAALAAVALVGAWLLACEPQTRTIVVPDELKRKPVPLAEGRQLLPERPPTPHYTLRMSEAGRTWEVELPEESGGYEVKIPLGAGTRPPELLTSADEEILRDAVASADAGVQTADGGTRPRPSYLGALARVNALYAGHQYELALIELVELEKAYPRDPRVASMKGSLFLKVGKVELARRAWERALQLNPSDLAVAEALRSLGEKE